MRCHRLALAALLLAAPLTASAHEDDKLVLDAFKRSSVQASVKISPTGQGTLFRVRGHGHYPDGTQLKIALRYIVGDTSEKHPWGMPGEKAEYLLWRTVYVQSNSFELKILLKHIDFPPGEYVVAAWYLMDSQEAKAKREFIKTYVPPEERKNPCRYCRRHFAVTKVVVTLPKFELRPQYASIAGPNWLKQKRDLIERQLDEHRDWYYQIESTRQAYEHLVRQLTGLGPLSKARIYASARGQRDAELARQAIAIATLALLADGLAEASASAKRLRLPVEPHKYWRRVAFGDGMPPDEDRSHPGGVRSEVPHERRDAWSHNYLKPRLHFVTSEMTAFKKHNRVMVHRTMFFKIRSAAEHLAAMINATDHLIDSAAQLTAGDGLYDQYKAARGQQRRNLAVAISRRFYARYKRAEAEIAKSRKLLNKDLAAVRQSLGAQLAFPVSTWPMSGAITEPPKLSKEENEAKLKELGLSGLLGEAK